MLKTIFFLITFSIKCTHPRTEIFNLLTELNQKLSQEVCEKTFQLFFLQLKLIFYKDENKKLFNTFHSFAANLIKFGIDAETLDPTLISTVQKQAAYFKNKQLSIDSNDQEVLSIFNGQYYLSGSKRVLANYAQSNIKEELIKIFEQLKDIFRPKSQAAQIINEIITKIQLNELKPYCTSPILTVGYVLSLGNSKRSKTKSDRSSQTTSLESRPSTPNNRAAQEPTTAVQTPKHPKTTHGTPKSDNGTPNVLYPEKPFLSILTKTHFRSRSNSLKSNSSKEAAQLPNARINFPKTVSHDDISQSQESPMPNQLQGHTTKPLQHPFLLP